MMGFKYNVKTNQTQKLGFKYILYIMESQKNRFLYLKPNGIQSFNTRKLN